MSLASTVGRRMRTSRKGYLAVLALGLAGLGGDCEGDIVQDATFRDWCGDTLCAWTLGKGSISRVPTWDANDLGVSFDQTPTIISQATSENQATCLLFTSVANIDAQAMMTLGVDFNNDGSIESTTTISATQWQKVQAEITAPAAYQGINFIITKGGTGTAVLAEMRIQKTTGCNPANQVEAGTLVLGDACSANADCPTNLVCAGGVCSQCNDTTLLCNAGVMCTTKYPTAPYINLGYPEPALPLQCGPGQRLGTTGAPCVGDDDCASGQCNGAIEVPPGGDAGPCDFNAVDAGASNCSGYEVRGGKCS